MAQVITPSLTNTQRYTTSKFTDIDSITHYGFRGEAINSLCAVSEKVVISTRLPSEACGRSYTMANDGTAINQCAFTIQPGTMISAFNLFHTFPVRKQYALKNQTRANKAIVDIVKRYCYHTMTNGIGMQLYIQILGSRTNAKKTKKILMKTW